VSDIESYLAQAGSQGISQGEGDFTLEPRRALEILREQGGAAESAPLFLFKAIYQHTGGATLTWKAGFFDYQLRWDPNLGELPEDTWKVMAEGAFQSLSMKMSCQAGRVSLSGSAQSNAHFEEALKTAESRLRYFPVKDLYSPSHLPPAWLEETYPEGRVELRLPDRLPQSTNFVVDGIEFAEVAALPLHLTVFDDGLRCDISLSRIPDSDRKRLWLQRARDLLLAELSSCLMQGEPIKLDLDYLPPHLQSALGFLPFVIGLPLEAELRREALERVLFRDIFEKYWTLESLLRSQREHGSIYVLPTIPRHCPERSTGSRPVLHWRGETRRFGEPTFEETRSGAGYVYSMSQGNAVDGQDYLNLREWSAGSLGLLPPGSTEARCEVQLVGKRRGSEVLYLEEPAPGGLRLVWRSEDELASWDPTPEFFHQVAHLLDEVLPDLNLDEAWLRCFLLWTGVSELKELPNFWTRGFLETVSGDFVSPQEVEEVFGDTEVSVLEERSASLPEVLPLPLLLWDDPILVQLGYQTREESSAVRKAYWREDGQRRWLDRFPSTTAQQWAQTEGFHLKPEGPHFWAAGEPEQPSTLLIWREGRPLGRLPLDESEFPKGYLLLYADDQFPADQYWSGPDREAISQLGPWLEAMKRQVN